MRRQKSISKQYQEFAVHNVSTECASENLCDVSETQVLMVFMTVNSKQICQEIATANETHYSSLPKSRNTRSTTDMHVDQWLAVLTWNIWLPRVNCCVLPATCCTKFPDVVVVALVV